MGISTERLKQSEAFSFILSYVKRHAGSVISGVILLMIVDFIQIIIPKIIQKTIDILGEAAFSNELILKNTIYILLLALGMIVIRFFWRVFIIGTARKIEKEVRQDMFSHLQILSFSYFNKTKTGDLMALMINDVNAIRMATGPSFIALTDAIFMGTLSLFFMFSINVKITLFSILPLPIIILMMAKFGPMIQSRFKAVQESFSSISSYTQESFSGIRVIKGFVQEKVETSVLEKKCEDYVYKNIRLIKIWGFFFPSITLLANLSLTIFYLLGGRSVIQQSLTFGEFISFTMYLNLLVWPVIAIGWVFNIFQRGIASSRRILDLLKREPDVFESKKVNRTIKAIEGKIKIRNLTFNYPENERLVLQNINLQVQAHSSLGIMGKPGSGKSTLVSLLFRLYTIHKGEISIDGNDINSIPLVLLRGSIGYVPQDPFLFSDTIINNIAFGLDEGAVGIKEIERVAKATAIYDEIKGFNQGFDTMVGERGITLSGGQKQRLSIARALIINPKILILDDAFSSVDADTEERILQNLYSDTTNITKIITSHRVSAVKNCDSIIILEDGRIIEYGSHEQLIERDGYYNKLFKLQKLEEEIA